MKPLKISLNQKITKWINIYTDFLTNQYKTILGNFKNFIASTGGGIK